jgi:hypothetical protein
VGLTVQQLLTPMSATQIRGSIVMVLKALGLQPDNWAQGSIASSALTGAANILAALSTQLSNGIAQQWNPTASGGGLALLSQYFYGITPPQPTFASGNVLLANTGGGIYPFQPGQFIVESTVANAAGQYPQYTNTSPFTLLALQTLTVPVQCTTIGSAGNAAPGFVSNIISSARGVSCTNPSAILGTDGLSDPALKQLNINSLAVRGNAFGPRGAYAYAISVAKNTVTGLPVNVNRQQILISSHTGQITIYVASPGGAVSDPADLQGISNSIEALARPPGITVLPGLPGFPSAPASATPVSYSPGITAYVLVPLGTTAASLASAIATALATWFSGPSNPIGGLVASDDIQTNFSGIFESGVIGLIGAAVATVPGCTLLSTKFTGVSDLPLGVGQVAVWAPPNPSQPVTVNIQYSS